MAGKRAGLKHSANGDDETTRSGLFMEAVRIIKEMRRATNGEYPKYAIWENVMGAFSSNSGEDFRVVLEELIKICEPEAPPIPSPGKAGWAYADCIVGDGWSLAWRVFDAQHWGVAQRRRRVYALLDLTGERAEKVLFERPGLYGHFTEGRTPWQGAAEDPQGSSGADHTESSIIQRSASDSNIAATLYAAYGTKWNGNSGAYSGENFVLEPIAFAQNQRDELRDLGDKAGSLQAEPGMKQQTFIIDNIGGQAEYGKESQVNGTLRAGAHGAIAYCFENHSQDTRYKGPQDTSQTVSATFGMGGNNQPFVVEPFCKSGRGKFKGDAETWKDGIIANTLNTFDQGESRANELIVEEVPAITSSKASFFMRTEEELASTLVATDYKDPQMVCYCLQGNGIDRADTAGCNGKGWKEDICYTLNTIDRPAVSYATDVGFLNTCEETSPTMLARMYKDSHLITYQEEPQYIVRRLTPTECARLQGFPDCWGDTPQKDTLTDEEYSFWLDVRNTHAAINGRTTKEYTKEQMLKWYNKLHSDSSEYKMWGNGIALPNALYVMQGIAEVMNNAQI